MKTEKLTSSTESQELSPLRRAHIKAVLDEVTCFEVEKNKIENSTNKRRKRENWWWMQNWNKLGPSTFKEFRNDYGMSKAQVEWAVNYLASHEFLRIGDLIRLELTDAGREYFRSIDQR